jgi:hypothetical protein
VATLVAELPPQLRLNIATREDPFRRNGKATAAV